MQKTIYTCDQDGKEIGSKKHISMVFAAHQASGIAVPPKAPQNNWAIKNSFNGKFMHFHNAQCLARYFSALMNKTK